MSQERVNTSGSPKRRASYRFVFTVASIAVPVGILFWINWGHDLHYNVYSNDVLWYREEFPGYFKLLVTSLFSIMFGPALVATIRIVQYLIRRP